MSKDYDPVQEYLRERGCPAHVVKMGLKGLVLTWEKVVQELVFDGYRYGLRDFVNDLDRREILAGAVEHMGGEQATAIPAPLRDRIASADQRFRDATVVANRCLLDEETVAERGVSREGRWWYFRFPRRHRANFAKDLGEAGIAAQPESEAR